MEPQNFSYFSPHPRAQQQPLNHGKLQFPHCPNQLKPCPPTSTKNLDFGGFLAPETHPITPPLNLKFSRFFLWFLTPLNSQRGLEKMEKKLRKLALKLTPKLSLILAWIQENSLGFLFSFLLPSLTFFSLNMLLENGSTPTVLAQKNWERELKFLSLLFGP